MRLTISRKLIILICVSAIVSLAVMTVQMMSLKSTIWHDRQTLLQAQVQSATSTLQFYADQAASGAMTADAAKAAAHDAVRAMRYGNNDYIFGYLPDGTRVIHADAKLEGKNAWDEKDTTGFYHIRALIQTAQNGGGFTTYYRARVNETEPQPKLSYTTLFQPWNWTIGTGVYVDDLNAQFHREIIKSAGWMALILVILCSCALPIARSISRPLSDITASMRRLAAGDHSVDVPHAGRGDEVGEMAATVQTFKDAAIETLRLQAEAEATREARRTESERQAAAELAKARELAAFVEDIRKGFDLLADGDLTVRLKQPAGADYQAISELFNTAVAALEDTIGSVVGVIGAIRTGLNEISVASGDLAQRTEQQAANLEETVAALGEVTGAVNQTAEGAVHAQDAAHSAQKNAEKGGEIVGRAVAAMAAIERSSDEIGKIIGVIDEIAFQTNLLALNAGVEAARAGEAGRGFAVVAQEVRGLAQRSAEAAKEIKSLISTSSTQVGQGVELVTASGRSLEEIVAQVGEMSGVVSGIARSAKEQATSLREVSTAADNMDKVTQQNAAMVEETTAAAQSLASETESLANLVQRFRTGSTGGRTAAPPVRSAGRTAVPQMRATGRGGAALKPAAAQDDWQDF